MDGYPPSGLFLSGGAAYILTISRDGADNGAAPGYLVMSYHLAQVPDPGPPLLHLPSFVLKHLCPEPPRFQHQPDSTSANLSCPVVAEVRSELHQPS